MTVFQPKLHIVIATIFGLSVAFLIPLSSTAAANINQLALIGTIEGKTYFTEPATKMTWQEGKTFCAKSGMRLATFTSVAQRTMLQNAIDSLACYWTGARDAMQPQQFVWDFNNVTLDSSVVTWFLSDDGMQSCVCFRPVDAGFFSKLCTNKFQVICELSHGTSSA